MKSRSIWLLFIFLVAFAASPALRAIEDPLAVKVSLTIPYPQNFSSHATDKLSIQDAVAELAKQAGLGYEFQASQANAIEAVTKFITPHIQGETLQAALTEILAPDRLDYKIRQGEIVLFHAWPADEASWGFEKDSLFEVQSLLATGKTDEALAQIEHSLQTSTTLTPPERMWLNLYRGCALDRAGNRGAAQAAFRAAQAIDDSEVTRSGLQQAMPTLKHLEILRHQLEGVVFRQGTVEKAGQRFHWLALVPQGERLRAVIRVGYPTHAGSLTWDLIHLRKFKSIPRDAILAVTDVLPTTMRGRRMDFDAPELRDIPASFIAVLDDIEQKLPIDPRHVYLTGSSFDGTWAWILGLDHPERYAGVVALSAPSYAAAISGRLARGKNLPVCVLRGEKDFDSPRALEQEKRTAAEMIRINPKSQWHLLPNETHGSAADQADICFQAILGQ